MRWNVRPAGGKQVRALGWTIAAALFFTGAAAHGTEGLPLRPPEVTDEVESAIARGLAYLARIQGADGSYGVSEWQRDTYPTAMSSLVGLAFLASGSTPRHGPYAPHLRKITRYLLTRCVQRNGLLSDPEAYEERPMYSHAFAMTYLAQVLGSEPDPAVRAAIRKALRGAVRLTQRAQTDDGGWGYSPDYWEDEGTLTVTQLQGLRASRDAGILVPKGVIDRGVLFIVNSTNADGGVRYRARSAYGTQVRHGVTCAAVVALWNAGRYQDDPLVRRIADYIRRRIEPGLPYYWTSWHHAEYVLFYLSQAKFVLGGDEWRSFYRRASAMLLDAQNRDGSWVGRDGRRYGEVFSTAIALIVLQLPYSRLPVYQR